MEKMTRAFCTIFDKNYLYQGVALYNSLRCYAGEFVLYALCMDSLSYRVLIKMQSESLFPINVDELLTPEISAVRERTTHGQFCWVCQPLICEFVLGHSRHDMVTYLEADSLFFSDPEVLFNELGEGSVSLVPHNFSPGFDNASEAGQFCVQFNTFRNDKNARAVLDYWKSNCFEYDKENPFDYPGQTSLDNWPARFDGVRVLTHPGAGVAPWNIQHREIGVSGLVHLVDSVPIVFYHFHQYGRYEDGSHELGHFPLSRQVIGSIYRSYVNAISCAEREVGMFDPEFDYRRTYKNPKSLIQVLRSGSPQDAKEFVTIMKRKLRGKFNVVSDEFFHNDPRQKW